jgi:hypothetical protein
MKRKAQVTVFIILGIILLITAAILFFLVDLSSEELEEQIDYTDTSSVQIFVEGCLGSVIEDAIFDVAQKGGYYELPVISTTNAYVNSAFYLYLSDTYLPGEDQLAESIGDYIENNIANCTLFEAFVGMSITAGTPQADVMLRDNEVEVQLSYPLTIQPEEGIEVELNTFPASVDSRILTLYNIAEEITLTQQEHNEMVCISCLAVLGYEHNLEVLTVDSDEGTLFSVFDLDSEIEGPDDQQLSFRFFHKYYDETIVAEDGCEDVSINIEFSRVENIGNGNADEYIYVGPDANFYFGEEGIKLTDFNDEIIIDNGLDEDVAGLALERGNGFVRIVDAGGLSSEDLEVLDFVVNIENAQFTSVVSDSDNPLENQGDDFYYDDASHDEIYLYSDYAEVYLRVASLDDGFYLYYECGVEE